MSKRSSYGVSVDIGTTNVVFHLVRLSDKKVVNQFLMKNPQTEYGSDIISRIKSARKDSGIREKLILDIRSALNRGIERILEEYGVNPGAVTDIVIVGNTVMHHLFFDLPTESLLEPPYSSVSKKEIVVFAKEVGFDTFSNAVVYSPPIVESFIGPDAIAVILASSFLNKKEKCLTIDVGTNTEVSVFTSTGIWITSAASGPAFEGMAIQCGMGGEMGAINTISIDPNTNKFKLSTIGNLRPRGICGTGAVSLLAVLLKAGILLPRGSFNRSTVTDLIASDSDIVYCLLAKGSTTTTGDDIILTQPDVRMLQQSKAAIRAAIDMVLNECETTPDEITEIFLTGVFGSDLQMEDVYRIGMFPAFPNAAVTQFRNGAIFGADMLLDNIAREQVRELLPKVNYIPLMNNSKFDELFVASLTFPNR